MSRRPPATTATQRIGVPAMFTEGRFDQVLILTFGAELEFYERVLRRHFGAYRNQIVLADGGQLDQAVADMAATGSLRYLNRSWLAGPVRTRHAAHAKAILLAGPTAGMLLVGSGNLNISGYAGAGECFTPYRWSPDEPGGLAAFTAIRALTDGLAADGSLDALTRERLAVFWSAHDWWHSPPTEDGPVRHNLKMPLGEQFVAAVGQERVDRLTVVAPFHDPKCAALDRLAKELHPRMLRVLVQPGHGSVDPHRLTAVLAAHKGAAYSIAASGDHSGSYLHAKIIVAVTKHRAICLTGSANCSMVALWKRHPEANVELGNLTSGPPDAFDHLFDPAVVTLDGPVDPDALAVGIRDDDPERATKPHVHVEDLNWKAPVLSGLISAVVTEPAEITIEIEGHAAPAVIGLAPNADGSTRLTAELTEAADIDAVERVSVVTIHIGEHGTAVSVPYQVDRLREQDRRRVDVDRLRHAARLELDDPDLEQALAALEEILVGENVARWGHERDTAGDSGDVDAATIAWADIDWDAVRGHPRFMAYGALGSIGIAGSDLAAYLDALSAAVRELAEPEMTGSGVARPADQSDSDDENEPDGGDLSGGVEGAEVDGVAEDEFDKLPAEPRLQSAAARNLRLIRNFVRRNLRALEQPAFREGAGPGITIPNAIILNWVCWWVATKDEDRSGELIEERLRLWRLLWGDSRGTAGYLDDLDEEHQQLVLEHFEEQRSEIVTLASMIDTWSYTSSYTDSNFGELRSILRRAVGHPCWQVTSAHLEPAARLINGRPTTAVAWEPVGIAETLWDAACRPIGDADTRMAVAAALGVVPGVVELRDQSVVVDGTSSPQLVREAAVPNSDLTDSAVEETFAAWQGVEVREHYRLKWTGGVALYRAAEGTGWIYRRFDDSMTDLARINPESPRWRVELDRLCAAAERVAGEAA